MRNLFLLGLIWFFSETAQAAVVASTLPASRSVQTGGLAGFFATMINAGSGTANNCRVELATSIDVDFYYQITNPISNAPLGERNTPVDIAAGGAQSFILGLTANSEVAPVDVNFAFVCDNEDPAPVFPGLNTLLFSASDTPVPDIIALSATLNENGIVDLPPDNQFGFFSVATINLGSSATIRVTTNAVGTGVSNALVCQTDPLTAACISDTLPEIETVIAPDSTPTFSIFLSTQENVDFDPANNRINVTFSEAGIIRGSTSVAYRSTPAEIESDNSLPTGSVLITGSAQEDATLGVNTSALNDDDGLGSFSFQWQRNGADITGANNTTYLLGDTDVDGNITVVVSYTDGGDALESVTSASVTVANTNDAPVIQDPPEGLVAYVSVEFDFTPLYDDIDTTTSEGEVLSLTVAELPTWLSFFPLDEGRITGTPEIADAGLAPVSITVQDDEGLSDTLSFTITVVIPRTVTLSWTAPTERINGEVLSAEELSLYKISYALSGQTPTVTTIAATSTSYVIPVVLTPGTYDFKVKAIDTDSVESDYSDEISASIN